MASRSAKAPVSTLHDLTLFDAVLASVARTPTKAAIAIDGIEIGYRQLIAMVDLQAPTPPGIDALIQCLRASAGSSSDENAVCLTFPSCVMTARLVMLRVLNAAVVHRAFSRDTLSASALPFDTATGIVAAMLPLVLGGTLHLVSTGDLSTIERLIASGSVNQAWLGPAELARLDNDPPQYQALRAPAPAFRLLICVGLPATKVRDRLTAWVGAERLTAESGADRTGPQRRFPGLDENGEPYDGATLVEALSR